ncbi:MAG TPA: type 1 glutamine amidotransferase domain-containing protein [Alphaproteobacteria bacterium]|nr:type 1 glutamine amidotransferase domain-containing protein [Alphaproteobacteria bacterium]
MTAKILMILTSHAHMGEAGKTAEPTGFWLEELTAPYYAFTDAGYDVTIGSIQGGLPPIDPNSLQDGLHDRYEDDAVLHVKMKNSKPVGAFDATEFDAIFLPGGHGTMWDMPVSKDLADLLTAAYAADKIIAAVCHGVAGFINVKDNNGQPLVRGRSLTAFSNNEESMVGLTDKVPFLLETRLRELGARYTCAPNFQPKAVRDGNVITGQNPASSALTASLLMETLAERIQQKTASA